IGFMVRSDKTDSFSWDEYLLYNPMVGYRWLVVQNGHCNFVTPLKAPPIKSQAEIGVNNFTYNNQKYERYTDEPAIVQFVLGEFYWAVRIGETVRTVDFICPPHMLSFEITSSEIMASLGEYMPMDEVAAAFKLDNPPAPFGVAPNQVNDLKADSDAIILMTIPFWLGIAVIGGKYSYDNLLTFSLLLLGYVFFYFKRMNGFENQRWENSDYASYHITASSDDSDD
ncbi:MAG: DUF4178 domain-containing protein, partial [Bdellovibrionales bacterium]